MSEKTIHFCYLYPDSFNLHGDRGNALAFKKTAELMGIDFRFERIDSFAAPVDFENTDILFVSPGELRTCEGAAKKLADKSEDFKKYIEAGKTMVVVGTTVALFAKETLRQDGSTFAGLGLVNSICKERKITYSNDEVFVTKLFGEPMEMIGGQIQMIDIDLNGEQPLGEVTYGYGNQKQSDEGIAKNRFYFTNALGPVFVKNPWFAARLLTDALLAKGCEPISDMPAFDLERKSNREITRFIELKREKYDKTRLE